MPNRIIEIASNNQKLSAYRGFLRIESEGNIQRDVPFNAICAVIVTGHQIVYTNNLLSRLCEENIPLIILGQNYVPNGLLLSFVGQIKQTEIQYIQIAQKRPIYKQIWQCIIQEKIKNQSRVLDLFHKENPLSEMHKSVLSGDSSYKEGFAAKLYFPALFGDKFVRDRNAEGVNAFLNYGYAVLRAALARYVVAAGLNPSYGIAHHNKRNAFCLVDDLIEPFRPIVDATVYQIFDDDADFKELTPKYKAQLSGLLTKEYMTLDGYSPLYMILQQIVWDLVRIYKTQEVKFQFNPYLFVDEDDE